MDIPQPHGRLLTAITDYVASSPHPQVQRFRHNVSRWGNLFIDVEPVELPAIAELNGAGAAVDDTVRELLAALLMQRHALRWEQSYTRADDWITDEMLQGYAWTDVIGAQGPFVSDRVRAAFGVWGAGIDYPAHYHAVEELYVVLAGRADFRVDGELPRHATSGDVIHIPSNRVHGFATGSDAIVLLGLCQNGDLREKSKPVKRKCASESAARTSSSDRQS